MAKIGINVKVDVKKLDKARFFAAQSGATYVDLTMFLDTENEGKFGDHGFVTQSTSKEEREQGVQMPIVGNGKIFYGLNELKGGAAPQHQAPQQTGSTMDQAFGGQRQQPQTPQQQAYANGDGFEEDSIPF